MSIYLKKNDSVMFKMKNKSIFKSQLYLELFLK